MSREVFNRYELKYLIPYPLYEAIARELASHCRYDTFGDGYGRYNIVSLYFDSDDHRIYYETRNRLRFRQKLRLRIYDGAGLQDDAFLEIKQKFRNVVNKRRTRLILQDAYQYINSDHAIHVDAFETSNAQIMREVHAFRTLYQLNPAVIVSYDRQAFHGVRESESDLRVTFDYNLKCRNDDLRVENGPEGALFVDPDLVIMEVKVSQSVPFWLSRMLSEYECPKKSVSKFCTSMDICTNLAERHSFAV